MLENIVHHFQMLFDVPSISGVYPTMNQIYTKIGEQQNVMKILKNYLGLGDYNLDIFCCATSHLVKIYCIFLCIMQPFKT